MDDKKEAERLFLEAYEMPSGMARHEALEHAARAADAADHLPLAVSCRVVLIRSCYDLDRYDLMLAPFAWCMSAEQRDPTAFDEYERHTFDWAHKWIPGGLRRDPRFSLAQIESVIEQLASRYQRHGYSMQPVHGARAELSFHIGDSAAFIEHFGRYMATESGPMSDCSACVVEEQVTHLVNLGRHAEAVAHAQPILRSETGCATQPQGVLTAVLPALLETGDVSAAASAHLTAYRMIKDDATTGYLNEHLEFCAVTGNADRGLEILRRNLHRITSPVSPSAEMHFAISASVLLSRVSPDVMFSLDDSEMSAASLLDRLRARALELAAAFDARNSSTACTDRTLESLERKDSIAVPLAVPVAVPVVQEPVPSGDPVEIAAGMVEAYDAGDFVTGRRLLDSLPPDMDALLPDDLAAHAAIRRMISGDAEFLLDRFDSALERLPADIACRYRAKVSVWLPDGLEIARAALSSATSDYTRVIAALALVELLDDRHEHAEADTMMAFAAGLDVPSLRARVLVDSAEHVARKQDLPLATALIGEVLELDPLSPSVYFDALRIKLRLETVTGQVTSALSTGQAFASAFTGGAGAEAQFLYAMAIEELDQEASCLGALRDAVALSRVHLSPGHTAKACFALGGGYLRNDRFVEAAETLEEALRLVQPGQDDLALQVTFRLGQVCRRLGEFPAAERHLRAAVDLVPSDDHARLAFTRDALGGVLHRAGKGSEAASVYGEAARSWEIAGEVGEAVGSWIEVAGALPAEEDLATLSALAEAARLLPAVEDADARTRHTAEIAAIRAFLHGRAGEFALAMRENQTAESLAASLEDLPWHLFLVTRGARLLLDASDPAGAETEARRAAALLTPDSPQTGDVVSVLTEALKRQNKPSGTDPLVRELTARLEA
ncbi:hypothetical protein Lesp02_82530 [Lentzea sp. NBRC 105346]|uniref:tetratricopeptide repeat protein n=1 Tax=Lentzea sp. NBRC 105346 TaxID=3032205 RepID=UPI0024A0E318|nr:tetratricopeptide repeat protein [Lentzea sp. NBRC 105346]GLZ36066.1 hypothetical protein Lesp02_82530 [Lentzea sp. NBRC 105346]